MCVFFIYLFVYLFIHIAHFLYICIKQKTIQIGLDHCNSYRFLQKSPFIEMAVLRGVFFEVGMGVLRKSLANGVGKLSENDAIQSIFGCFEGMLP